MYIWIGMFAHIRYCIFLMLFNQNANHFKLQQVQKMSEKQKAIQSFLQNYRQFIEFINDLHFSKSLCIVLIYLPSLTIFPDLFSHIGEGHFLRNLSDLNFAEITFNLITKLPWLFTLVKVLVILILLLPVILIIMIALSAFIIHLHKEEIQIGCFYIKYNNSFLCKMFRLQFCIYQRVLFPIITSMGVKLLIKRFEVYDPVFGVLFLILSLANSGLFHYYTLQIPSTRHNKNQYKQINFPNAALESVLILITIILVNATQGLAPFISCVCLFIIRALTNFFLKYQTGQFYYENEFSIFCGIGISLSMLIGYLISQFSTMALCSCIIVCLLLTNKKKQANPQYKIAYQKICQNVQPKQITIEDIKTLVSRQKISQAFREAVVISRRKNSHRNELIINILKSKCFHLERESRGSIRTANSLLLIDYEATIVKIIKKTLQIQQKSIEALTIMKSKQPKQQILIKTVIQLVNLINDCKIQFIHCMKINSMASQLLILMHLFFRQLYNDSIFIRQTNNKFRDLKYSSNSKIIQKQLFNSDTVLIVVNMLDEIGKITNVSNNFPNVLGYSSTNLIGLSINQLIPLSIRSIHDQILLNFINRFSSDVARNRPLVQSYAYTKSFHLQKVQIRYNFFLHIFQNFLLSGVVRKLKTQDYLIMTDQMGNIQGWTPQIGEIFNFDELSGTDCNAYNMLPIMPACIKNDSQSSMCFRTIFFRLTKMKTPKLMLFDFKKYTPTSQQLKQKQFEVFTSLLQKGQIIQGFLVNVEIQIIRLQNNKKIVKLFKFYEIKRLQNFQKLQSAILGNHQAESKVQPAFQQQFQFSPGMPPEKSFDQSEDNDYSILKSSSKIQIMVDLNFTLQINKPNIIDVNQLKFNKDLDRLQNIYSSRSLLKIDLQEQKNDAKYISQNLTIQSTFNPKLERKNSFILLVIFVSIIVVSILIQDQISLSKVITQVNQNKTELQKANRAQMIFCKSTFNPNSTYISEFNNGNLFVLGQWLLDQNSTYTTYEGIQIVQNKFYTLNVQIPSTLDHLLGQKQKISLYNQEIGTNFFNIINLYESMFTQYQQVWENYIDLVKKQCLYKLVALAFSAIIYLVFLIFIYRRYQNQRKMTEAFFKFQRTDLDSRISSIKSISSILQKRCQQWFIDQQINQIKKVNYPTNNNNNNNGKAITITDNINSVKKITNNNNNVVSQQELSQRKNQTEQFDRIEEQLGKKRLYFMVGLATLVLTTQALFLILHGILSSNMLNSFKDIIQKYDQANKLVVYPNIKIANLFYGAPTEIVSKYEQQVQKTLDQPSQYMPDLYNLLSNSPCKNCSFMTEILNTNYRSFYSHFIQIMGSYNTSSNNLTELFYSVDVVTQNITKALTIKQISNPGLLSLLCVFSLVVFFVGVIITLQDLEEELSKLQCFLKFFDVESLLKNKHMSTVMAKNM